ncbi:MAG: peptidase S10 [Tunicatimonas sp.]
MFKRSFFLYVSLLLCAGYASAQKKSSVPDSVSDPPLVTTQHSVTINGQVINYSATAGYLVLREEDETPRARMFFVAYTKNDEPDATRRPITFAFNGGPGSSSVWLHLGALGPKRVRMTERGESLPPPYDLVDNEYSWLDNTDLVFIDPVETGYSRPAEGVKKSEFTGYEQDIESVGDFIRLYTTRNGRWSSPKFLAGESYGTTRAAGLSGYLQDRHGMYLNGLMLVSAILNFQTARFGRGNDLPYALFLPTYAATAHYHGKLPEPVDNLEAFLSEVEEFAQGEYTLALMQGDNLSPERRTALATQLHRYTGLDTAYLRRTNYRIHIARFVKELRRDEGVVVGRLDSRLTGQDYDDAGDRYDFDPSLDGTISGPYTTALNAYLHDELNYRNDLPYEILTGRVRPWDYSNVQNEFLNVAETLREAMSKNPFLKVHVFNGYYDLATPYFATEYTFDHMLLRDSLADNVSMSYYPAGHMMYIHQPSLVKMKQEVDRFIDGAVPE